MTDFLPFIDKRYYQEKEAYHFNSDTVLLGLFLPSLKGKSVLDIGTQAAALLLYAQAKGAKELVGIDICKEALFSAQKNCSEANFFNISLQNFSYKEMDVLICNPPFYKDNPRKQAHLAYAYNSSYLPLDVLFQRSRSLLKSNGSLYLIYPASCLNELVVAARENDFSLAHIRLVYDCRKEQAIRVLCQCKRGTTSESRILSPVYLQEGKILNPEKVSLEKK